MNAPSGADEVRQKIIEVASGDPHLAEALRGMLWNEYCDAGQPFGPSEEAMFRWAAQQLQDLSLFSDRARGTNPPAPRHVDL